MKSAEEFEMELRIPPPSQIEVRICDPHAIASLLATLRQREEQVERMRKALELIRDKCELGSSMEHFAMEALAEFEKPGVKP